MPWSILEYLRKDPEVLRNSLRKRFMDESLVDNAIKYDVEWRKVLTEVNNLRHKHNQISQQIAKVSDEERRVLISEAKELLKTIEVLEKKLDEIERVRDDLLTSMPNIVHPSVPVGSDDSYNIPIRAWGRAKVYSEFLDEFLRNTAGKGVNMDYEVIDWRPIGHADMLEYVLKLGDTLKAAEVSSSRFYYLFDDIVWLDIALLTYAIDYLTSKGFKLVLPPYMLRQQYMAGVVDLATFKDAIYKVEGDDLYLIATAEHSLAALHAGDEIPEEDLPLLYVGVSPCFRREAGAGSRDIKGIFRVHQFHKVEQFAYTMPEQSWDVFESLISNAEELYRNLELPYRLVNVVSGELGSPAAKKYDLEVWYSAQGRFRELVSCSNCTDWQAYRLKIRYLRRKGTVRDYLHTLNSTAIASTRTITAVLENHQKPDGVVEIPKALRKYLEVYSKAPKDYIHPAKR
ncbi:MAG: serine--tRNA ligase [Sulfolobales archaeon]|nr:serine--tRNA ligase [Sulfolobales archaeon]